jgi:hypothetical protein
MAGLRVGRRLTEWIEGTTVSRLVGKNGVVRGLVVSVPAHSRWFERSACWLVVLLMVGIELQSKGVRAVWSFSCIRLGPFGVFDIGRCRVD